MFDRQTMDRGRRGKEWAGDGRHAGQHMALSNTPNGIPWRVSTCPTPYYIRAHAPAHARVKHCPVAPLANPSHTPA